MYTKWKNNRVSVISIHTYFNFFHLFSCVYDESQFGQAIEEGGDRYMPPTKSVQHISNQSSIFLCISILHYFHTGQNIDITIKFLGKSQINPHILGLGRVSVFWHRSVLYKYELNNTGLPIGSTLGPLC